MLSIGPVHFRIKGCWVVFYIFLQLLIERLYANSRDPYETPLSAASDLGLRCLPMSHKKDARLVWVK